MPSAQGIKKPLKKAAAKKMISAKVGGSPMSGKIMPQPQSVPPSPTVIQDQLLKK